MASKKKSVEASSNVGRVKWGADQFNKYVDVCVDGTLLGKRQGNGWGKTGWTYIKKQMADAGLHFTKDQMKHKWDWMGKQWRLWKELIGKDTGLGWNPITGTIDAPAWWWEEKEKENPHAADMHEKGIGKELFDKYELLFNEKVATGKYSYAPSCDPPLNETEGTGNDKIDGEDGSANLEEDFDASLDELMECGINFSHHRNTFETQTAVVNEYDGENGEGIRSAKNKYDNVLGAQNKKNKKLHKKKKTLTGAELLSESVKELKDSMVERTSALQATLEDNSNYSITKVMEDVLSLPGVEAGSDIHIFSSKFFLEKPNREMYSTMPTVDSKLRFLEFQKNIWANNFSNHQ